MILPLIGNKLQRLVIVIACLGLFGVSSGCVFPLDYKRAVTEAGLAPVELKHYADAVDVYNAGDYETSAKRFQSIREQTANPRMSGMALFGLACSRLMLADSPETYQKAVNTWEYWVQCAPRANGHEDPVLLAPVLKEKMIFSQLPWVAEAEHIQDPDGPNWYMVRTDQELRRLRNKLDAAEEDAAAKEETIKALEKEIMRLNEQINAFEKIDEKIQKKKNAIPSTD